MKILKLNRRAVALISATALLLSVVIGATLGAFFVETPELRNTFVVGDVDVALTETETEFLIIPEGEIAKDPLITVEKGTVSCWIFVKADESDNLGDFVTYAIADGWTQLEDASGKAVSGVYYRNMKATECEENSVTYQVIKDNKLTVRDEVTKKMLDELTEDTYPSLNFTAYAVQESGFDTAYKAWQAVSKQ